MSALYFHSRIVLAAGDFRGHGTRHQIILIFRINGLKRFDI